MKKIRLCKVPVLEVRRAALAPLVDLCPILSRPTGCETRWPGEDQFAGRRHELWEDEHP